MLKIEERLKIRGADLKVASQKCGSPPSLFGTCLARVCYRRRARNDLECHPVLEVSPELYHRLIKAGFVYVGLQRPGMGPVPAGAVFALSRIRTWQAFCKEVSERCAHCGGAHWRNMRARRMESPQCVNGTKAGCDTAWAFSSECGVRAKWDDMARSKVATASSALAAEDRTHTAEDRRPKDALTAYSAVYAVQLAAK
ncbi:hypothetical protein EVAR_90458_1 [Eumeta japonica]|uniref:Uncharacterized protein n=1 Tax=Eumeta variegata TaxID=151549 RepID=A0A4C1SKI5_EUMVA|nr:hypothetical protein EVAR_90458_1 [Eumeta japonica]